MNTATLTRGTSNAFLSDIGLSTTAGETGEGLSKILADWYQDSIDRINHLRKLKPNWDSYGAYPVNQNSIIFAEKLVYWFAQETEVECPRIAASPAGYVALSWEWQEHSRELDLEILSDGGLRYSYLDESQPSQDCDGEADDLTLIAHLLTQ